MKFLILLILTIFSLSSFAENWTSINKLGTHQGFQLQQECERVTGQECFDLGELPDSVYSVTQIDVDDYKKPIYTKNQVESCSDISDCDAKFVALVCIEKDESSIKNYDLLQIYCSKVVGYEQKKKDVITLDSVKKSAYDSEQIAKSQESYENFKISVALKKMDCGKRVIAKLVVLNSTKNLTTEQIATMNGTYSTVKTLLETGSLETAKASILGTVADGVVILESDKTELVKTIDACK